MREESAQKAPAADLSGFPTTGLTQLNELYRSTTRRHGPGYFSADGSGRFDLEPPDGTLYAARSMHTAVMERIAAPVEVDSGDGTARLVDGPYMDGGIDEEDAEQVLVWTLINERALRFANLTAQSASSFGVTKELSSGGGVGIYRVAQSWATRFNDMGLDGVEYSSRFTSSTSVEDNAIAVFGPAGANWGPFEDHQVEIWSLVDVAESAGINIRSARAAPPPPASETL